MTVNDEHLRKIREHLDEINDAIDEGIEKKPITIGFHTSACALELLELYLHVINKISQSKILKHNWFKRPQAGQKIESIADRNLNVEFPHKEKLYSLIYDIEDERNSLLYGKPSEEQIKKVIDTFIKFKNLIIPLIENEGTKI